MIFINWLLENAKEKTLIDIYKIYEYESDYITDYVNLTDKEIIDKILKNCYGDFDEETLTKLSKNEIKYYDAEVSTDSYNTVEKYLSGYELNYENDLIIIKNEGF